jgi:uncharacterized protein YjbJ (UPF0337 family)
LRRGHQFHRPWFAARDQTGVVSAAGDQEIDCRENGMSSDRAEEARKGLFDTVAGKAKEVAGALSGNDELATEGQLQQAGAQERKEANSREALADMDVKQATDELHERTDDLAEGQRQAHAAAAQREQAIAQAGAAAKADAEANAQRQQEVDSRRAEDEADVIARGSAADAARLDAEALNTERHARLLQDDLDNQAAHAEHQAAQLRAENNRLRTE